MVDATFNVFDLVVILIVSLSALLSFFRGFVREVLSLGAWVGASLITMYEFPRVAEMLSEQVQSKQVAFLIAIIGTFVVALICISILNAILMRFLKKGKDVGLLDNFLGLAFGVLRAVLVIALGYFVFSELTPENRYPTWLTEAHTKPYVEMAANGLKTIAPDYVDSLMPVKVDAETGQINNGQLIQDVMDTVNQMKENGQLPEDGQGYDAISSQDLQRLIEQTQEQLRRSQNLPPRPNVTE